MNSVNKIFFVFILLFAFQLAVFSQTLVVDFRAGTSGFRGETSKGAKFLDELGHDFSVKAYRPFNNSKWQLSAELSYSNTLVELDIISKNKGYSSTYNATATHYYLGTGARYILNNYNSNTKGLESIRGLFLPYVDMSAGLLNFKNSSNQETASFGGYKTSESIMWDFIAQLELGVNLMLSENIGIGAFSALRTGFSDLWDGIEGTTNVNDWQVRAGLQVTFAFE